MADMVTVEVAKGRSIHKKYANAIPNYRIHGPGEKVEVEKKEIPRLIEQGFIVDPDAKPVDARLADQVDIGSYLGGDDAAQPAAPVNAPQQNGGEMPQLKSAGGGEQQGEQS